MAPFEPKETIFRNESVLQGHYVPDELVGREEELEKYHKALQPVMNGSNPNNILLLGKSGVGKTVATKTKLRELEKSYHQYYDDHFSTLFVNCEDYSSSYQVMIRFVNMLRDDDDQISTTGHPSNKVKQLLRDEINKQGGVFLFVLDEINHLSDDSILYEISRAKADESITDARIGLIGISNALDYRETLSGKVKSSLNERRLRFPAYTADDLRAVLQDRVENGLQDGVIDDGVIALCAAHGAADGGDARNAIDLLYHAAQIAQNHDDLKITTGHVDRARDKMQENEIVEGIQDLSEHERIVLYALATFEAQDKTPVRNSELYERYLNLAPSDREPRSSRRVRDFVSVLEDLSLVKIHSYNGGRGQGRWATVSLDKPLQYVVQGLSPLIEDIGLHTSIRTVWESKLSPQP